MIDNKIINAHDSILNYVRRNKVQVTIFLLNGVKMIGLIVCFDQHCVVLKKEGYIQLVYKHAISTISPHANVAIFDWNNDSKKTISNNQ